MRTRFPSILVTDASHKWFQTIVATLIFMLLEFTYINFVFENYEYSGFKYQFDVLKYAVGKALFIGALTILFSSSLPSFIFSFGMLTIIFLLIPNLIMYQFSGAPIVLPLSYILFIVFLSIKITPIKKIHSFVLSPAQQGYILLALGLVCIVPFIYAFGIDIDPSVMTFGDIIYVVREQGAEKFNVLTSYLYSPLTRVILPIGVIWGIDKRRYVVSAICAIMMLYLFLIIPHKATFFTLVIMLVFMPFRNYLHKISYFAFLLLLVLVVARFVTENMDKAMLESMLVRRVFFVPAMLNDLYFDFFSGKPLYLSHSIFGSFIDYPYDVNPSLVIGQKYFGEASANTGVVGDAFMNFGYIGIVVFLLLFALLVKLINKFSLQPMYFGLIFIIIVYFQNFALLTMLFTHGLGIMILLIIFLLNSNRNALATAQSDAK